VLDPLYELISFVVLLWHGVFDGPFGTASGTTWALSIIFLVVTVRLVLFPVFVKQIRSQRAMQTLQPQIKELQQRHKGDRETLQRETLKLYKENKANPISGCLPLFLQIPVFLALFHVLRRLRPGAEGLYGWSDSLVDSAARAKVFGAPISAAFNSPAERLADLSADAGTVRLVTGVLAILMALTTFITQKQMMARSGAALDPQTQLVQKFLLYVMPASLLISGGFFPLGVLLYWFTTNVWSMGQQYYVIKRMPPPPGSPGALAAAAKSGTADGASTVSGSALAPKPGVRPQRARGAGSARVVAGPAPGDAQRADSTRPPEPAPVGAGAGRRPQSSRKKKTRKGGRR